MTTKRCTKCGQVLPLGEFYRHRNRCKACYNAHGRAYRAENAEYCRAFNKKRWHANPQRRKATKHTTERWEKEHPKAYKAGYLARNALSGGHLLRQTTCTACGASNRLLHMHHEDYAKPLDVIWLCAPCHHKRHTEMRAITG